MSLTPVFMQQQITNGIANLRLEALRFVRSALSGSPEVQQEISAGMDAAKSAILDQVSPSLTLAHWGQPGTRHRLQMDSDEILSKVKAIAEDRMRYLSQRIMPTDGFEIGELGWLPNQPMFRDQMHDPQLPEPRPGSMLDRAILQQISDATLMRLALSAFYFAVDNPGGTGWSIHHDLVASVSRPLHRLFQRASASAFELGMLTDNEPLRQHAITLGLGFFEHNDNAETMSLLGSMRYVGADYDGSSEALRTEIREGIAKLRQGSNVAS